MKPTVKPLTITNVNWTALMQIVPTSTKVLDAASISLDNPVALTIALSAIGTKRGTWDAIEQPDKLLKHTSASFIVVCDDIIDTILVTSLHVSRIATQTYVLTGTLLEWYDAVIRGTDKRVSLVTRQMFNDVYNCFCGSDIKRLWVNCKKTKLEDGTITIW